MTPHETRPSRRRAPDRHTDIYSDVTLRILSELEAGRIPWVQPWSAQGAPLGMPRNAATGRTYSGINVLLLWGAMAERGFSSQAFLTFRQALSLGAHVRKGEKGTMVVFADRFTPEREKERAAEEGREAAGIAFLKRFTVFSTDQCEDLPEKICPPPAPIAPGLIEPEVDALINASGADLRLGGTMAYYDVLHDFIAVPRPETFHEPVNWHRTALHELSHWTGAAHRLARDQQGAFGSAAYGREELVAELSAAFLCATLGIVPTVRHADYLGAWLDILREDDRAILRAASAASKAADYLLAFRSGYEGATPV